MRHLDCITKKAAKAELPSAICDLKGMLADLMYNAVGADCPCYADKCASDE